MYDVQVLIDKLFSFENSEAIAAFFNDQEIKGQRVTPLENVLLLST